MYFFCWSESTVFSSHSLSRDQTKALSHLHQDNFIAILPADKGKAVVLLDASDYQQKMDKILSGNYIMLDKDPKKKL